MNNEDFQKKREESVLLAKEESGGGFNSTATSERLDSSIEITSQSSDRSTLLPVIHQSLQTPESNQAPDQPLESKVVSHLSTNLDAQTNQPPPAMVLPVPFLIYGATDFAACAENILGDLAYLNDHHDFSLHQFTNATILAPRNAESHMGRSVAKLSVM